MLDFGIARASALAPVSDGLAGSATTAADLTMRGVILGTAAYMSPEQAKGAVVDQRTDVWAFGCVLFEMLTGRRAFPQHDPAEILAAVLTEEPSFTLLPPDTPAAVTRLLRRCLAKDRQRRLRHLGDALLDLEDTDPPPTATVHRTEAVLRRFAVPLIFLAVGGILGALAMQRPGPSLRSQPPPAFAGRFSLSLPSDVPLANLEWPAVAISPDGRRFAFTAGTPVSHLFVRERDEPAPRQVPGTDGALSPFFSPDSQLVAFFAEGRLKKVAVQGGDVVTVCGGAANPRGGAWNIDGTIAFTPAPGSALFRVSANGGTPEPLTKLDVSHGEGAHHWPEFMPDGKGILYTAGTGAAASWDDREIIAQSLTTGERHPVAQGSAARYVEPGMLIVARGGGLSAVPFDASTLRATGAPRRITESVLQSIFGATQFSVSREGTITFVPGGTETRELVWYSRDGAVTPVPAPPRTYLSVRLAPDEQRLALGVEAANYGVWIYDFARGTMTRQTFEGTSAYPIWTPDGSRITYNSTKAGGVLNLFWRRADGSGDDERLAQSDGIQIANSWSPDGTVLAFQDTSALTGRDVWLLTPGSDAPRPFLRTPFQEGGAQFSPDGRWIAYVSNEAGNPNVYVRPFPGPGEKMQISSEGGGGPVWSRNSRELFYRAANRIMAVDLQPGAQLQAGTPHVLFTVPVATPIYQADYDVSADGKRFIMIRHRGEQPAITKFEVAINVLGAEISKGPNGRAQAGKIRGWLEPHPHADASTMHTLGDRP
jgi:Tol biopolymer transport system component